MNKKARTTALPKPSPKAQKGWQIGTGHGGNTVNLPKIQEVTAELKHYTIGLQPGTRLYLMGKCKIFVSPPFDLAKIDGWHMSISHPKRYPTWDEIAKARYELLPQDRTFAMLLPPPDEYINIHNFCFHLHEFNEGQGNG